MKNPIIRVHKTWTSKKDSKGNIIGQGWQWSWKVEGKNGKVVAAGHGLSNQPTKKYIIHIAAIMLDAVKVISKKKSLK